MDKKFDLAKTTIKHIVSSKYVLEYSIGITCNPSSRLVKYRGSARKNKETFGGFALLAWGLSAIKVLDFESELYSFIQNSPKSSNVYMKVHNRFDSHSRSLGGKSINNKELYYIYISWTQK